MVPRLLLKMRKDAAMKRILFPVDFSARSASAAKYAAALTCRSQAELTVLHVTPGHAPYAEVNDVSISPAFALELAWNELRQKESIEKMTDFVSSHLHGVPATPSVRTGDAAKIIVERAEVTKADLIVMATHGFGGFRRMLLGSITAKVLHDTDCPVFTTAHPEPGPATVPPFRNILCAIDFGPQSEAVVRWADDFARSMGSQLFVSHIVPIIPMGQWGDVEVDLSAAIRKDAEDKGRLLVDTTGVSATFSVETGPVVATLRDFAKEKNADLLVIGRHHESGILGRLRDTAYAIIRESPCPVVSV
jgi:nucleotide-binding universal stress UspA family protein